MGEFKGRLVQPPSTSKREIEPKNRMLEKLLACLSVSTAASLALAACGIAEGSTNPQPQTTEPIPLSSPTPDALNQFSNIELFNLFVTNQTETGHQFPTPTVFSSSEGTSLKPEQSQSIEQLLNTFVGLAQNQKVLNFSNDGLGVNTDSLGQVMIEDTLVFDFGHKGKAGMFLVSSEKGNKAYYLSNNGEAATQLVFSIRYKDGSVEAFFDPKQVEAVLKKTDPNLIESTNWNGIFMRPEVLGDNPADNFFATTQQMQYEGEGNAFLFDVLSLDQQNLAMFDPGTLDMGFFKVEAAAQTEPTEEPTPAPIFGSKVLMSILAPTPTVEEVLPTAEPTPTAEPIPTLSPDLTEGIEGIPDPRITNPELFDLTRKDAPIPQFVNALKKSGLEIDSNQIIAELTYQEYQNDTKQPYYLAIYDYNGAKIPLFIGESGQSGEFQWSARPRDIHTKLSPFPIGSVVRNSLLNKGGKYTEVLTNIFNSVIVDYNFGWIDNEPKSPPSYKPIDGPLNFKEQNDYEQIVIQHLVWWAYVPNWLKDPNLSADQVEVEMRKHIREIMTKYQDKEDIIWVVVNEANTPGRDWWAKKLGSKYYLKAFEEARLTNPKAKLYYSDYGNETQNGDKTAINKQIINELKNKDLIDGIALHMRINAASPPKEDDIVKTVQEYNMPFIFSELDVDLSDLPKSLSAQEMEMIQSEIYAMVIRAALRAGQCQGVYIYGVGDAYSWLETDEGKTEANPTLTDEELNLKYAIYRILAELLSSQ